MIRGPVACAAGPAALRILAAEDPYPRRDRLDQHPAEALEAAAAASDSQRRARAFRAALDRKV
ncbi:MAG: hypothetical protein JSV79_06125 [Armatimonadota bacterium]|nr:MAG: hypothetical protein JSV79_06125 [Armatimonadota bacterium]